MKWFCFFCLFLILGCVRESLNKIKNEFSDLEIFEQTLMFKDSLVEFSYPENFNIEQNVINGGDINFYKIYNESIPNEIYGIFVLLEKPKTDQIDLSKIPDNVLLNSFFIDNIKIDFTADIVDDEPIEFEDYNIEVTRISKSHDSVFVDILVNEESRNGVVNNGIIKVLNLSYTTIIVALSKPNQETSKLNGYKILSRSLKVKGL